jgi:hypothetical protein
VVYLKTEVDDVVAGAVLSKVNPQGGAVAGAPVRVELKQLAIDPLNPSTKTSRGHFETPKRAVI